MQMKEETKRRKQTATEAESEAHREKREEDEESGPVERLEDGGEEGRNEIETKRRAKSETV